MMTTHEDRLNLAVEKALEPEMPICDPHFHFFTNTERKYFMEDLLRDIGGGHNIVKNVYIDCHNGYRTTGPAELQPVGETEFVVNLVAQNEKIIPGKIKVAAGIVGAADLNLGEAVAPVLEAHVAAGKGRFRGIRQSLMPRRDPRKPAAPETPEKRLAAEKQLREGFACLNKLGLSFETVLSLPHLAQLKDLAKAFPKTNIIINHAGMEPAPPPPAYSIRIPPPTMNGTNTMEPPPPPPAFNVRPPAPTMNDWKNAIAELAPFGNIFIKLGGFSEMPGINWRERPSPAGSTALAEAAGPHVFWCIQQFGSGRCMFESNYPIESLVFSFNVVWNAFKLLTKDMSKSERKNLFYDTTVKAYRL